MKQRWGMCQMRRREAESRQLCFLFVGIRLTDLYLVSEGPLASANPHHLQTGTPAPPPLQKVSNSPFCGLITLHFGNKANTHPQTQASHYVRLTTTSAQRKRDSLSLCTLSQSIRAGCEVLLCWFWRDSNYQQIKLKCYGNCLSVSLKKRGEDAQMLSEEP